MKHCLYSHVSLVTHEQRLAMISLELPVTGHVERLQLLMHLVAKIWMFLQTEQSLANCLCGIVLSSIDSPHFPNGSLVHSSLTISTNGDLVLELLCSTVATNWVPSQRCIWSDKLFRCN